MTQHSGITPGGNAEPQVVPGIELEPGLTSCRDSALPTILPLLPTSFFKRQFLGNDKMLNSVSPPVEPCYWCSGQLLRFSFIRTHGKGLGSPETQRSSRRGRNVSRMPPATLVMAGGPVGISEQFRQWTWLSFLKSGNFCGLPSSPKQSAQVSPTPNTARPGTHKACGSVADPGRGTWAAAGSPPGFCSAGRAARRRAAPPLGQGTRARLQEQKGIAQHSVAYFSSVLPPRRRLLCYKAADLHQPCTKGGK